MQVFPDTVLRIHKGCPCDPDYEHTINIGNKEGQHAYFTTITKYRLNDMSYQRPTNGRIRVPYNVNDLYDCNYISFQNTAFGNKWFYAFIDSVEYVNNTTSEINYTVDVLQTWMYDIDLTQCFVAREHSVTDVAGDNLVPESVDTGDLVSITGYKRVIPAGNIGIACAQTGKADGSVANGHFYGKTYAQAQYYFFDIANVGALQDLLQEVGVLNNQNAVTSVFACPDNMVIEGTSTEGSPQSTTYTLDPRQSLTRSDGSGVRNQKLNTSPYTKLRLINCNGDSKELAYEYFGAWAGVEHNPRINVAKSYGRTLSLTAYPIGYKTFSSAADFSDLMTYQFPEITWATSNYSNRNLISMLSAGVGALTGGLQGGLPGAVIGGALGAIQGRMSGTVNASASGISDLPFPAIGRRESLGGSRVSRGSEVFGRGMKAQAEALIELGKTPIRPLENSTRMGNPHDMLNAGIYGFFYTQLAPLPQFIDRIDDYFSRYGYATNKIKVPNIDSRPHWNYVQTVGCKVNGSIPCNDERLICSIFDKGVTFWKNPAEVGNFSLDNSPA